MREDFQTALEVFRDDPALYFEKVLGAYLEDYQKDALYRIFENDRIGIRACHDLGKSWLLARIVLALGSLFPYSKTITTAPTYRQVEKILWSEIRSGHEKAKFPLGGKMLTTEWKIASDWFAVGFAPRAEATGPGEGQGTLSSFQGFHAPYIFIVFDEATGINRQVWTMAEGLMTSGRVKFICIGNPTSKQSEFYRCFHDRSWTKIHWSCFHSPNLIANGVVGIVELEQEIEHCRTLSDAAFLDRVRSYKEPKPHLLTLKWVVTQTMKWGMRHPLTLSKILGEFPDEGDNVKMPLSLVEAAQEREWEPQAYERRSLGVDVARYGSDSTVFTYLHGKKFCSKKVLMKHGVTAVTGEVIAYCNEHGWPDIIVVDETGVGGGVVDLLIENQSKRLDYGVPQTTEIRGVQFGAGCNGSTETETKDLNERYSNVKARMYDLLSENLQKGLTLLKEDVYMEELPTILYSYDSKGRLKIESKDDYKKRTGRGSPDHADSLALANYGLADELRSAFFTKDMIPNRIDSIASGLLKGEDSW